MRLIDTFDLEKVITIQDTDVLRRDAAQLPEWLSGTPTLICRTTFRVFKGIDAIEHVATLAVEHSSDTRASRGGGERRLPSMSDGLAAAKMDTPTVEDDRGWPSVENEQSTRRRTEVEPLHDALLIDDADDDPGARLQDPGRITPSSNNLDFGQLVDPETLNAAEDGKISEADVKRFMSSRGM
jgi:hypothetical protein